MAGNLVSRIREILACGIQNPALWNPEFNSRNPESLLRLESWIPVPLIMILESGTWFPESTAWGGGHWGYPIPQYRTKNLQIPKYRVENGWNTDTVFMIGDAYLTLYPPRVCMYTPEINLSLREKTWEDLELIGTTIEKPGHWMSYKFHHSVTVRNCVFSYR